MNTEQPPSSSDFIRNIVDQDLEENKNQGRVATRFPPEPNGYIHIGHAKAICLDFGVARQYGGTCNLRMDDTDPAGEDMEYVQSIMDDIRWLGFDWENRLFFASDYYERLYEYAVQMIKAGKAFVCDLSADAMREYRGTLTEPGKESPCRNRSVAENLDLFARMRAGEFAEGSRVLRAKIDMASPNMTMRDPIMYRIKKERHYRTNDQWAIYPMYDFAHCLSDYIERITHSICTLEFENNRPLYDWFLEQLVEGDRPRQIEFARLNLTYTVMSKRKLMELVEENLVSGWDDPRMPTIRGMRRRGFTSEAIRTFCERIGVAKNNSLIDIALLEDCVRDHLNETAPRVLVVMDPLKIIIDNYPENTEEEFDSPFHPQNQEMGSRKIPFGKTIYIERDDFLEDPPKKFFRLSPGKEVRLRYGYYIKCIGVEKNPRTGAVEALHCTYDPETRNGFAPDGRKVSGTIHWVAASHAIPCEIRLYDRLFNVPDVLNEEGDYRSYLNPASFSVIKGAMGEPYLKDVLPEQRFQFERTGYFIADSQDFRPESPVFNRTVTLRDSWAKKKGEK